MTNPDKGEPPCRQQHNTGGHVGPHTNRRREPRWRSRYVALSLYCHTREIFVAAVMLSELSDRMTPGELGGGDS
jgi:hypothetical protein